MAKTLTLMTILVLAGCAASSRGRMVTVTCGPTFELPSRGLRMFVETRIVDPGDLPRREHDIGNVPDFRRQLYVKRPDGEGFYDVSWTTTGDDPGLACLKEGQIYSFTVLPYGDGNGARLIRIADAKGRMVWQDKRYGPGFW